MLLNNKKVMINIMKLMSISLEVNHIYDVYDRFVLP